MSYFELEPENNTFTSLVVDLTHRCNMNCKNCYIPNRKIPDLDVSRLYELLKRLPNKTFIRLIGAEPTMRNDLPEIVSQVIKLGHRPSVTTNGLKLADEALVLRLKKAGLKYVYISMNGADVDQYYLDIDGGRFAEQKVTALRNLLEASYFVALGCIVAKDINERVIERTIEMIENLAKKLGLAFNSRYLPTIRFKSVGEIGRYMQGRAYSFSDLTELVCRSLKLDPDRLEPCAAGTNTPVSFLRNRSERWKAGQGNRIESYMIDYPSPFGPINIRLVNWDHNGGGVINAGNLNRGRVTQDWKIAPFFEHVKLNEFGY